MAALPSPGRGGCVAVIVSTPETPKGILSRNRIHVNTPL